MKDFLDALYLCRLLSLFRASIKGRIRFKGSTILHKTFFKSHYKKVDLSLLNFFKEYCKRCKVVYFCEDREYAGEILKLISYDVF